MSGTQVRLLTTTHNNSLPAIPLQLKVEVILLLHICRLFDEVLLQIEIFVPLCLLISSICSAFDSNFGLADLNVAKQCHCLHFLQQTLLLISLITPSVHHVLLSYIMRRNRDLILI